MHGIEPPAGSTIVASEEYAEYRLDVYFGTDQQMYCRVHPKQFDANGMPIRARMYGRANILAKDANYPPIKYWSIAAD